MAAADVTSVDVVALQAWVGLTDQRLDATDTAITGVSLNLEATVGHAKGAMNAIIQSVRTELLGFKRQVHTDHQQLNAVVSATQQKFIEVEGTTQQKFVEVEGSVTNVAQILTTRLARAEHQISLLVAEQQRQAAAPPLQTPASTPPQSPRLGPQPRSGTGGAAHFTAMRAPAQPDPWQVPEQPVTAWLVEHVSDVLSKYLVGADGHTAYERLFGKQAREEGLEFGEQVLFSGAPRI